MVVLGISIFKNLMDKRNEAKALKQLSDDFDEYQKDCLVLNDSLNEELSKVENEFKEYSYFVSESIAEAVSSFDVIVDLSSSILNTNASMLRKIEVLNDFLEEEDISVQSKELVNFIFTLKNDIMQNNIYSEQLRKEFLEPFEKFQGIESKSLERKTTLPPLQEQTSEHKIDKLTPTIKPDDKNIEL